MNHRLLQQGFTMIEMVITIVILGTIAGIGAMLLAGGVDAYLTGERVMTNAPAVRLAMDRILLELRPACDGGITVNDTQIDFFAPGPDCVESPDSRVIRLNGNTGDLELQVADGGAWYPLARNASLIGSNPVFALATDPVSGCQTVTIQFRVTNSAGDPLPVRSAVFLENQPCIPPAP